MEYNKDTEEQYAAYIFHSIKESSVSP